MLADELDYVVGVDPHRDTHALAVVEVRSGGVVFEATVAADGEGYASALRACRSACAGPACVRGRGHRLVRRRPDSLPRQPWRAGARGRPAATGAAVGGKTRRARRDPGRPQRARPEAASNAARGGEREALRALMAAREGAVNAKRAGLCQLRDLLGPRPSRCGRAAPADPGAAPAPARGDPSRSAATTRSCAGRCSRCALVARRVKASDRRGARARTRDRDAHARSSRRSCSTSPASVRSLAAQVLLSWSHRGRITSEAAFARLAGVAPIPASSGQTIRYRLDRGGDRSSTAPST